ncbi:TPA: hypothetical protein ACKR1W_003257 [Proteus mirabilis]
MMTSCVLVIRTVALIKRQPSQKVLMSAGCLLTPESPAPTWGLFHV